MLLHEQHFCISHFSHIIEYDKIDAKCIEEKKSKKKSIIIGLLALYLRTASMDTQYDYGGQMCKVNAFIAIYMNWTRKLTSNRV